MMLACDDTITLVKCDGETYTATVIDGVSWYDKTQVKVEGTGLVFSNAVKVRIPASVISVNGPLPEVGDHIIRGLLPLGTVLERPADLGPFHPRKVMAVADNRRGGLPHVAVVGQ